MFTFKLFLIALLACVIEGEAAKAERSRTGATEKKRISPEFSQALGELLRSRAGDPPEKKEKGDTDISDITRLVHRMLRGDGGVTVDMKKKLGQCFETCVNSQQEGITGEPAEGQGGVPGKQRKRLSREQAEERNEDSKNKKAEGDDKEKSAP